VGLAVTAGGRSLLLRFVGHESGEKLRILNRKGRTRGKKRKTTVKETVLREPDHGEEKKTRREE